MRAASVAATSFCTNVSATAACTYTREHAEHLCPFMPKAERNTPLAARSRSALSMTIAGFLPPISTMHGRG